MVQTLDAPRSVPTVDEGPFTHTTHDPLDPYEIARVPRTTPPRPCPSCNRVRIMQSRVCPTCYWK